MKFPIGVIIDSFRTDIPTAVKKAAKVGAQGIQVYATSGEMSPEELVGSKRADFRKLVEDNGLVISALCGDLGGGFGNKEENTSQSAAVKQYEVPDFVSAGYTQSDIENNGAWNKQFKLTFVSKYSTDVEEGIVFEQSVESGKKVDEQTEIQLTVSKGVQTESVPNVAGQSLDAAKKTLEDKGFKVSTVEIYNDGSHEADTVKESYASAPAAGETVAVGEEIVLQVYGEVQTTTAVEPENDVGTD